MIINKTARNEERTQLFFQKKVFSSDRLIFSALERMCEKSL